MPEKEAFIKISGMSCGHCVKTVKGALEAVDNIKVVDVQIGHAKVRFDSDEVDRASIKSAVDETGFEVESISAE